jgi:hypothetical protein
MRRSGRDPRLPRHPGRRQNARFAAIHIAEELAWNTGLVCGGTMWILAEAGDDAVSIGGTNYLPEFARRH